MKKLGFTLAEILITMGIIGVVAALAAPSLVTSSNNAKIGPMLQKAVSTFETAAEMLLHDEDASGLIGVVGSHNSAGLGRALSKYMKIDGNHEAMTQTIQYQSYKGDHPNLMTIPTTYYVPFRADDGSMYIIELLSRMTPNATYPNTPNNQYIGSVYIDVNGEAQPNKIGKDLFRFAMYNDGTLRAWGSKSGYYRPNPQMEHWESNGHRCDSNNVENYGWTCAGSIFDNNMKVIYR